MTTAFPFPTLHAEIQIALVGGMVRDHFLGRPSNDTDYVVFGATVAELRAALTVTQAVGKDFPVFLLPDGSQVAMARKERKVAVGTDGFETDIDPSITLETDLSRRDLTINAMAVLPSGELVDPFGGRADLEARVLRHVGPAFVEDPLRVMRLARFAAQLGFTVAPETVALCRQIPRAEFESLSRERVGVEFLKAMDVKTPNPRAFVEVLEACGVLEIHFPELQALRHVPAGPPEHHPEGDALTHTLMVLDQAVALGGNEIERTAALLHDLGKGVTDPALFPKHHGHEEAGVPLVAALGERVRLPTNHIQAAQLASELHLNVHRLREMRPVKVVDLLARLSRTALGAKGLALVSEADARGRTVENPRVEGPQLLRLAAEVVKTVTAQTVLSNHPTLTPGPALGEALRVARAGEVRKLFEM